MKQLFEYIANAFELLGLLIAIRYYTYLKKSFLKWLLPFLAFIFVAELLAKYLNFSRNRPALLVINYIIAITESVFYGFLFYCATSRKRFQLLIHILVTASVISYCLTYIFYPRAMSYFSVNLMASGFCLTLIALTYLFLEFSGNGPADLKRSPVFWIAVGVSLFFSTVCLSLSLYQVINIKSLKIFDIWLTNFINRMASVILYSCLAIGILKNVPQKKKAAVPRTGKTIAIDHSIPDN